MFRAHLLEHPLWRRPHHDNPSPATWSRRRLHNPISRTTRFARCSNLIQSPRPRRPQCWAVCQTQTATTPAPSCDGLGPSRSGRNPSRQLSACPPHCHGDLSAADIQSSCFIRQLGSDASPCKQPANRSTAASFRTALRYSGSNASITNGIIDIQPNLSRSSRTPASHRPCSGRFASTSKRSEHSRSPIQFVYHGDGL